MTVDSDTRKLLYKIAKSYYEDGLTQQQIGKRFGLSRIKVSRLLHQAREDRIVQITVLPPLHSNVELERALEDRFGLLEVVVVSPASGEGPDVLSALGPAAAGCLTRCLSGKEIVGLSWGTTLHAVIEALPVMNWTQMSVVQLLGGLGQPQAEIHGTDLTRRMATALGAQLRLLPAPGVVSSKLVCDALLEDPQIQGTLELAEKADVALLGIGTPLHGSVVAQSGILSRSEIIQFMEDGAVGDIALRFFDAFGKPMEHEVNDRTIGLSLPQIKNIPRRIGVAGGEGKFEVVLGAIRGQLVNVLVTDDITASQLLKVSSENETGTGFAEYMRTT